MTLKFLDPFGSGKLVLLQVTYDKVSIFPLFDMLMLIPHPRIGMRMS